MHARTQVRTHARKYARTHASTHARTHAHTHACTHVLTHSLTVCLMYSVKYSKILATDTALLLWQKLLEFVVKKPFTILKFLHVYVTEFHKNHPYGHILYIKYLALKSSLKILFFVYVWFQYSKNALNYKEKCRNSLMCFVMSARVWHSNCFRCTHKGDFPKFGHICDWI